MFGRNFLSEKNHKTLKGRVGENSVLMGEELVGRENEREDTCIGWVKVHNLHLYLCVSEETSHIKPVLNVCGVVFLLRL